MTTLSESDEESYESTEGEDVDDPSPTALSRTADGSDATTASTTALGHLVDGSDAPPASATALYSSVDGSDVTREGEAVAAGAVGDDDTPVGNGATGDSSIPPMRKSTLFSYFRRGVGSEQLSTTAASVRNGSNVSTEVEDGIGTTPQVSCPPAASNARASSSLSAAAARRSTSAPAVVGGLGSAVAAPAATPAIADQDACVPGADENCVGQSPLAGIALANSFLSVAAEAAQTVDAATADRVNTTTCTGGCVGPCGEGHAGTFIPAAILAATAPPAVANLYLQAGPQAATPARGGGNGRGDGGTTERVRAGAAVGEAVGAVVGAVVEAVVGAGDGGAAGALVETPLVNMAQFLPRTCTVQELRAEDPRLQRLTAADNRLIGVYGDTIHLNDGTHLDGGIGVAEDAKWQRLHLRVASCRLLLYDLPNGRWANRFLETLTDLWQGCIKRRWNSERPLVFQACILRQVRGISRFHDVKPIIWGRLDAWDKGQYVALVKDVEEANLDIGGGGGGAMARQDDTTSMARKYHNMVLGGKVRAAVRMVTNRDVGRAYRPFDTDSKSGRPVIDVLREKHPDTRVPSEWDFDEHPGAPDCLESMLVYCYEECVAKAAAHLSGSAGPCGIEADMLKNWLLRHGAQSEHLRDVMAMWVDLLSNGSPPYAAYRVVNTVRAVALEKCPGLRPLGVGEV